MPERLKRPVPFVGEALPLFKDRRVKTVLDLGCGVGRHCIFLAKRGFDVVGVDTSRKALKMARAWSDVEEDADITVLRASMTSLPFAGGCFQGVISVSIVHHAAKHEIRRALEDIYRVLKDDGVFLANLLSVEDCRYGSGEEVEEGTFKVLEDFEEGQFEELHHFFTREEASDLLARFRKVNLEPIEAGKKEQLHCYWKVTAIR